MPSTQLPGCERFQVCRATTPAPRGGCGAGGQGAWTQLPCSEQGVSAVPEPQSPGWPSHACLAACPRGHFSAWAGSVSRNCLLLPTSREEMSPLGASRPPLAMLVRVIAAPGGCSPPAAPTSPQGLVAGPNALRPVQREVAAVALGALSLPICRRNLHRPSWNEARRAPQGAVLAPRSVIRSDQRDSAPVRVNLFP